MTITFPSISDFLDHGFDTLIDVRSPAEFAEDHLPGAISLPVLDNEERARVGTLYKQVSPFTARKLGAALIFRNAATHVETQLSDHDGAWRPLVYCWRGGQRSGSFAWMLNEIGWRSDTVAGGYKSWRRLVTRMLYTDPLPHQFVQLGGYTGTAKTAMLALLKERGVQVLDLEALARHRGSLLGGLPGGQPSQKAFETAIAAELARLSPTDPVVVEAESSKIGDLLVPPSLWAAMKTAPWIELQASVEARAVYLAEAYQDILADKVGLREKLEPLRIHRGHDLVAHWNDLIDAGDQVALCRSLAEDHYDPAYRRSMRAIAPQVDAVFETASLADAGLAQVADQMVDWLQTKRI